MIEKGATGATGDTGAEGAAGAVGAAGAEGAVGRQGLQGEPGPASMLDPKSAAEIKGGLKILVVATVVLYVMLIVGGIVVYSSLRGNNSDNAARIADIQQSRVDSCKATYQGIREVFRPFFPPQPRTMKQQADLDKFNRTIDRLRDQCGRQTAP